MTSGRRESGPPVYTFGGRVQGHLGPFELGIQAKRTGPRYVNDENLPRDRALRPSGLPQIVRPLLPEYPAEGRCGAVDQRLPREGAPGFTDGRSRRARLRLGFLGLNDETYLQLNVTNLFDRFYVANFTSGTLLQQYLDPFVQVGAPRRGAQPDAQRRRSEGPTKRRRRSRTHSLAAAPFFFFF